MHENLFDEDAFVMQYIEYSKYCMSKGFHKQTTKQEIFALTTFCHKGTWRVGTNTESSFI